MLTARNEEYDKLNGFRLGVDDYVAKPFSPKELMARIGAVLLPHPGPIHQHLSQKSWPLADFPFSRIPRIVTLDEKKISLPPKEFDLLYKLAQNEHIVLSRDKLLETVWGYRYCGDARTVDPRTSSPCGNTSALTEADPDCMGSGV